MITIFVFCGFCCVWLSLKAKAGKFLENSKCLQLGLDDENEIKYILNSHNPSF